MENVVRTPTSNPQTRLQLFTQTLKRLDAHGTAEEQTLFLAMQDEPLARAAALEALEWHRSARRILRELTVLSPWDELWLPKMLVVRGIIAAHIRTEEETTLRVFEQVFDPSRIEHLDSSFHSVEDDIQKKETVGTYEMASKLEY